MAEPEHEHAEPTWRSRQNRNGDGGGLSIPKWFMSISSFVYLLALPWAIWVTNTLYKVQYQTEGISYTTTRLDKMADQLRVLERQVDRLDRGERGKP
mgnify:CR=1 FL=1